ncbi:hypothetical protein [Streptomyces sp. 8N706]|uniref:hypothetical protein n=1 Tax=Streptomyces sp. 8N706 TaxID=3457416 RepID=UPI003FD2BFB5
MKTRLITSLALPAALATAGLLNSAEAAFANSNGLDNNVPADSHEKASYGDGHHCPPLGNITWVDYGLGHCDPIGNIPFFDHGYGNHCPPLGNVTIVDYGNHCPPVANATFFNYDLPGSEAQKAQFARDVLASVFEH